MALLLAAAPATATTYVPMSDEALADGAPLIVEGTVVAIAPAADAPASASVYTIEVGRVLEGTAGPTLEVRLPGGVPRRDRPWTMAWGVPRFDLGEEVLLFLVPHADGTHRLHQLALGAFRLLVHGPHRLAVRPELAGHSAFDAGTAREAGAFADWLAARARGEPRPADYRIAPPAGLPRALAEAYRTFTWQGKRMRWFHFDNRRVVRFVAHDRGQPGLADGGRREIERAMESWSLEPASAVELRLAGTGGPAPWGDCDGRNLILFEDPFDEIAGRFDCEKGGVVAVGTVCLGSVRRWRGEEIWQVVEGDVLTQDGAGCIFARDDGGHGEFVFAHELGHALGFAHSCGDPAAPDPDCTDPVLAEAIMASGTRYPIGRRSRLGADDRAALAGIYPLPAGDDGGGGGDPEGWISGPEVPGFRFRVTLVPAGGGEPIVGARESRCLAETVCASGALPGRVEVLMRVPGPKPNGKLWPTFVKLTTSEVVIEVEQIATGERRTYTLAGAAPGIDELPGLFDRDGFDP